MNTILLLIALTQFTPNVSEDGSPLRAFVANVPEPLTSHPHVTGMHYHRCPNCGDRWRHGIDANESRAAHSCHKCGIVVLEIDEPTTSAGAAALPAQPTRPADSTTASRTAPISKTDMKLQSTATAVQGIATAVCRCGGSNRGVCYCLKSGAACRCSAGVGSVWLVDAAGKPLGKTGEYKNPSTNTDAQKPTEATPVQPAMIHGLNAGPASRTLPTAGSASVSPLIPAATYRVDCRNGVCRRVFNR